MTAKAKNYSGIAVCQICSTVGFCCSSLTLQNTQIYLSLLFMFFPVCPICGWYVRELYFTQSTVWGAELDLNYCSQDKKNHGRDKTERNRFRVWLGIYSLAPYLKRGGLVWWYTPAIPPLRSPRQDDLSTLEINLTKLHIWKTV